MNIVVKENNIDVAKSFFRKRRKILRLLHVHISFHYTHFWWLYTYHISESKDFKNSKIYLEIFYLRITCVFCRVNCEEF